MNISFTLSQCTRARQMETSNRVKKIETQLRVAIYQQRYKHVLRTPELTEQDS